MKALLFIIFIILFTFGCSRNELGQLIHVSANKKKGFEYPYFLFIPNEISASGKQYLIVEPNNSGFVSDIFNEHLEKAERTATKDFYIGNYLARKLKFPLLVPIFPRSESEWKIYTHALDRDAVLQKDNQIERIDLQLIAMVKDAADSLSKLNYSVQDKFLMTGFSASGTFVNRFSLIHPDQVFAIAAGGVNGLLMLPIKHIDEKQLQYPLGISDFNSIFGKQFDKEIFRNTPQFLFMGELDDNDAIPFDDGYDVNERDLVYELIGKEMQPLRWNKCMCIYNQENVNVLFKTYKNVGHEYPNQVKEDILLFFQNAIQQNL